MNRPVKLTSRPQLALQSYLEDLLRIPEELPVSSSKSKCEALRRWMSSRQPCWKSRRVMRKRLPTCRPGCCACRRRRQGTVALIEEPRASVSTLAPLLQTQLLNRAGTGVVEPAQPN